jgi:hypothetical protein
MQPEPAQTTIRYPAGALLKVKDICGDRTKGKPGLLPVSERTWQRWAEDGLVSKGVKLGLRTRAWRVEEVMAMAGQSEAA